MQRALSMTIVRLNFLILRYKEFSSISLSAFLIDHLSSYGGQDSIYGVTNYSIEYDILVLLQGEPRFWTGLVKQKCFTSVCYH